MDDAIIRTFDPADTEWVVAQHATLYTRDDGFDDTFGPLVASILTDFNSGHDGACERGWIVEVGGQRLGSIFCVRHDAVTAKLRLFLLLPEARGLGLGQRLLQTCMGFAEAAGYGRMQLWTHESHAAACALYRKAGWRLEGSRPVHSFSQDLVEQTWVYRF